MSFLKQLSETMEEQEGVVSAMDLVAAPTTTRREVAIEPECLAVQGKGKQTGLLVAGALICFVVALFFSQLSGLDDRIMAGLAFLVGLVLLGMLLKPERIKKTRVTIEGIQVSESTKQEERQRFFPVEEIRELRFLSTRDLGIEPDDKGPKFSLWYVGALTESGEKIAILVTMSRSLARAAAEHAHRLLQGGRVRPLPLVEGAGTPHFPSLSAEEEAAPVEEEQPIAYPTYQQVSDLEATLVERAAREGVTEPAAIPGIAMSYVGSATEFVVPRQDPFQARSPVHEQLLLLFGREYLRVEEDLVERGIRLWGQDWCRRQWGLMGIDTVRARIGIDTVRARGGLELVEQGTSHIIGLRGLARKDLAWLVDAIKWAALRAARQRPEGPPAGWPEHPTVQVKEEDDILSLSLSQALSEGSIQMAMAGMLSLLASLLPLFLWGYLLLSINSWLLLFPLLAAPLFLVVPVYLASWGVRLCWKSWQRYRSIQSTVIVRKGELVLEREGESARHVPLQEVRRVKLSRDNILLVTSTGNVPLAFQALTSPQELDWARSAVEFAIHRYGQSETMSALHASSL